MKLLYKGVVGVSSLCLCMDAPLDLAEVLAAIEEVTKPYQLGIQLKIDSSQLDTIEKNHPRDIGRQKTEVIKYWLHNSPDASWTTLAKAVERMGGHARLAETLREKEQSSMGDTTVLQEDKKGRSHTRLGYSSIGHMCTL